MSTRNIKKNTTYNTISTICSVVFPLITFPYASRMLLTESIGKVNFGNSIISYFSLLASLGINTFAVRECAKVRDNQEELDRKASEIFSINIMSTIISYIVLAILLIAAKPLANYRELIMIQSTVIIFTTFGTDWINTVMEDFRYVTIRSLLTQTLFVVLLLTFVHKPEDYLIYAVTTVTSSGIMCIANTIHRRKYCRIRFTPAMNLGDNLKPILGLFSLLLAQTIYCNSDATIIGLYLGDSDTGIYTAAARIYTIVNQVVASVTWVVMAQLTVAFKERDYEKINPLLRYGLNYIILLGLPCIVGINVIARPLVVAFAGEAFAPASVTLQILSIALIGSFFGGFIGNMILIPSNREKISLIICIISALMNLVLNLIFIPKFGYNAAAVTTAVSEMFGMIVSLWFVDKDVRIGSVWKMIKAPIVGSLLIVVIAFGCGRVIANEILLSLTVIAFSVVAYAGALILLKDEFFSELIKGFRGRE